VATLSYTATLQALGMLCDVLLERPAEAWSRLPELAAELLERSAAVVEALAQRFAEVRALDAVGGGPALASAGETMLLAREALRIPATGMETREYLHGPLEAVEPGVGCVVFGGARERDLAAELASFGAPVALISDGGPDAPPTPALEIPAVPDLVRPILQILPVQLLIARVARLRGLEIGKLRRSQPDTKLKAP
jgi:fructoselysine-6-P-deglycase FrlB-like protein